MANWLVFTDLDGTLMDEKTYSVKPALNALEYLAKRDIPVIACTSKTANEVMTLLKQIGQNHPFIVENGSAIYFPEGYFGKTGSSSQHLGYGRLMLGSSYSQIKTFFNELRQTFALPVLGISEMDIQQIITYTGLSVSEANVARQREFSEPFALIESDFDMSAVIAFAEQKGFRILVGNRFHHLLGASDKGKAVKETISLYKEHRNLTSVRTIGIGDSKNDLEMLYVVDHPVMVKKRTGRHLDNINVPKLLRTSGIGPEGWQEAIFHLLKDNTEEK